MACLRRDPGTSRNIFPLKPVSQEDNPRHFRLQCLRRQFRGVSKADQSSRILSTGAPAAPGAHRESGARAGPRGERTVRPRLGVRHLVCGDREHIDLRRLHIDRDLSRSLHGVTMNSAARGRLMCRSAAGAGTPVSLLAHCMLTQRSARAQSGAISIEVQITVRSTGMRWYHWPFRASQGARTRQAPMDVQQ